MRQVAHTSDFSSTESCTTHRDSDDCLTFYSLFNTNLPVKLIAQTHNGIWTNNYLNILKTGNLENNHKQSNELLTVTGAHTAGHFKSILKAVIHI